MSRLGSNATLIHLLGVGLGLGLACGPGTELPGDEVEASSGGARATGTTGTSPSDGVETTAALDTSGEPPSTYEDDDGGTGCTFTCPDPPPPPPLPTGGGGGGITFECDLLEQDCPEGEKCMPWANDGGGLWNATRCSPIADSPGWLHEVCTVEGSGVSGIDDCAQGLMCTGVDPQTNVGTCSALCSSSESGLLCDDPDEACAVVNDVVPLCVEACDPLMSDCGPGRGCYLMGDGFVCDNVLGEAVTTGEPCWGVNSCRAGLICAYNPAFDCGEEAGQGCCAAFCDVSVPDSCLEAGALCIPWIPVAPPPQWADLGVCVPA